MNNIIEGKSHALEIRRKIKEEIAEYSKNYRNPRLAVIIAGNDAASLYYASLIKKAAFKEGINADIHHIEKPQERDVIERIEKLNSDSNVDGIIMQLPLPSNIDKAAVVNTILPLKDVDGQNPINLGRLVAGQQSFKPATARAVLKIIKLNEISLSGKKTVVVGRSTAVGLPASIMLIREDAAVSVCHSKTRPLEKFTSKAEILVVSAGKPKLISSEHVAEGAAVIDVGTNEVDGKMVGDVNFDEVIKKASVSPVKGGVGALTMACLLENTFYAYKKNIHNI
ncbi:MAG: bifunctional 5,10-methylenetetrahydrofolate dehydrogenase/5,10-methenyltetrahydrofolate cyclohydrolase [Elusimicrobiota bacterium]